MKLKIYSLRDQKTDAFMNPIAMQTTGQLLRMLSDEVNKQDSLVGQHPEDFELFEVGEYDTQTGTLTPCPPKSVIVLNELKAKA